MQLEHAATPHTPVICDGVAAQSVNKIEHDAQVTAAL
jgi:hypothetical protein